MEKKGFVIYRFALNVLGSDEENQKTVDTIVTMFGKYIDNGCVALPFDSEIAEALVDADTIEHIHGRPEGSLDRKYLYAPIMVFEKGVAVRLLKHTDDDILTLVYCFSDKAKAKDFMHDYIMCAGSDWKHGSDFKSERRFAFNGEEMFILDDNVVDIMVETILEKIKESEIEEY